MIEKDDGGHDDEKNDKKYQDFSLYNHCNNYIGEASICV